MKDITNYFINEGVQDEESQIYKKLYHVMYTHYTKDEADALCRMILGDGTDVGTFKRNFTTIRMQQPKNPTEEKYVNWVKELGKGK